MEFILAIKVTEIVTILLNTHLDSSVSGHSSVPPPVFPEALRTHPFVALSVPH